MIDKVHLWLLKVVSHSSMLMKSDFSFKWNVMTSKSQRLCETGGAIYCRDKNEDEKIRMKNDEVVSISDAITDWWSVLLFFTVFCGKQSLEI